MINTNVIISKEQFLLEHNKLSPVHLQVTLAQLTLFQLAKKPLLKDSQWSHRLRMPLILWLDTLPKEKKKAARKSKEEVFKNYPETHNV